MATLELVALVVEVVYLRQAGVQRPTIEEQMVQIHRLPRHAARRLIGQVENELQTVRRRLDLPLALSAEALLLDCVEMTPKQPQGN